jgi:hypothetical protein
MLAALTHLASYSVNSALISLCSKCIPHNHSFTTDVVQGSAYNKDCEENRVQQHFKDPEVPGQLHDESPCPEEVPNASSLTAVFSFCGVKAMIREHIDGFVFAAITDCCSLNEC